MSMSISRSTRSSEDATHRHRDAAHHDASFVPSRTAPRDVAVGFYSRLVEAGFTGAQIFDLTLELLDQVAHEKRADLDVAGPAAAK